MILAKGHRSLLAYFANKFRKVYLEKKGIKMKKASCHLGLLLVAVVFLQIVLLSFGQESLSADQQWANNKTYLADLSNKLNKRHPNNPIVNIICIGNSVPAGFTKTPLIDPFSAYPHLLHRRLKQKYPYAILNVIVSARGSETSIGGMARFPGDVLLFAPDLITIDYGLTDRVMSLRKSKINLGAMIGLAKKRGIKVLLLTPTHAIKVDINDPNDPLNQQAEQIRNLAKENKVGLVDSYAAFQRYIQGGGKLEDLLANKINHPNQKGHELVTNELLKWFPK